MHSFFMFFGIRYLIKNEGGLKILEFIELCIVMYLILTENKFNIEESTIEAKTKQKNTLELALDRKSVIKQKIGEFCLLNLGELYLRFKAQCKDISTKSFVALITSTSVITKNRRIINILHKILDTNDNMTFKTLYCLNLYLHHRYELCEKIAEKSLHNSSYMSDNSNYKYYH